MVHEHEDHGNRNMLAEGDMGANVDIETLVKLLLAGRGRAVFGGLFVVVLVEQGLSGEGASQTENAGVAAEGR